jgi:hypothetical protein
MDTNLFSKFRSVIYELDETDDRALECLLLEREGRLSIYYAPLDHITTGAKVVLVGITPGRTQMVNALRDARQQFRKCRDIQDADCLAAAKRAASFSGTMRPRLVEMLDYFGINKWLGVVTCHELFQKSGCHLLHATSVLRYPVFKDGADYNGGGPNILKSKLLWSYVSEYFVSEAKLLRNAVFIPLGDTVSEVVETLTKDGVIAEDRVLTGFPHPSGANNERINYLLEKKSRSALSSKTNALKLDKAREQIKAKVASLTQCG